MKSMRKATAWAMALAMVSTSAMGVTAFAEGEAATTTAVTTEAPTEAPTATPTIPAVTSVVSADFGTVNVKVDTAANTIEMNDSATGMKATVANGVAKFDGTVINAIDITNFVSNPELTDAQKAVAAALLPIAQATTVNTVEVAESVTDVNALAISSAVSPSGLTVKFGKNIKNIKSDALKNVTAPVTVQGYAGTAAETFAKDNNYTFVALDAPVATTTATEAPATTTAVDVTTTTVDAKTTAKATTAKTTTAKKTTAKATTTAKSTDSPKTGDAGVGAIAGVAGLAVMAGFIAFKKRED